MGSSYTDLSDMAHTAEELLRADELREALISSSPLPIVVLKATGEILLWNRAAEQVFGWSAREVLGAPLPFIPPERQEEHKAMRAKDLAGQGFTGVEIQRKRKDGTPIEVSVSTAPLHNKMGEVIGILSIYVDITAQKQIENDLAWQARELARSNADLQRFAHVVSHDLQEPLRAITSFTQLLANRYSGAIDPAANDFLAHIVKAAQGMNRLINDLLAYSRVLESDNSGFENVDMNAVMSDLLGTLHFAIAEANAVVEFDPLPSVSGRRVAISQLLLNLLTNALKYRNPATPPHIKITARQEDRNWVFAVSDNGIGIDPKHQERIFGMFQRLDSTGTQGSGIGLALCKTIVERHAGHIWVQSSPNQGATFFFTLPIRATGVSQSEC